MSSGVGGVTLIDGQTGEVIVPSHFAPRNLSGSWELPGTGVEAYYSVGPYRNCILWDLRLLNHGRSQRWFEVRLGVPIDPERGWMFWDGRNEPVAVAPDARILGARSEPIGGAEGCTELPSHHGLNTPMSAAWSPEAGLAVALRPREMHSYFAGGAEPGASARDALYYATRVVVDPRTTEQVVFTLFAFDPQWEERGALEQMYEAWRGDYIGGGPMSHCMVTGMQTLLLAQPFVWEEARRLGTGWIWGTMARYAGLCYPEEGRQPTEAQAKDMYRAFTTPRYGERGWVGDAVAERGWLTPEEHIRYVEEAREGVRDALAVGFDITAQYADKGLVESEFPESRLMTRPGTPADIPNLGLVYAWGDPYGEKHAELVSTLIDALKPAGVNLDNAVGYDRHYGEGVEDSPGRAFDAEAQQVYVIDGIAHAMQMARAREHVWLDPEGRWGTLDSRGTRPWVGANTIGTHFGATLCNVSLIEALAPFHDPDAPPWRGQFTRPGQEHYLALRYLLGAKMMIFRGPYPWQIELTEEQKALPPPERDRAFIAAYEAFMADYPLFAYRVGAGSISYVLVPCANVRAHTATVPRLARAGWQPVPGARADAPELWVERFGNPPGKLRMQWGLAGAAAYLTIGNPTDEPVESTVRCEAERIGAVALTTDAGETVPVTIAEGGSVARAALLARTPVAWRMVAGLSPPPPDGTTLRATETETLTRIEVDCPAACATTLTANLPEEQGFDALTLNGAPISTDRRRWSVAIGELSLPAGRSVIRVEHHPWYAVAPEVAELPFLAGDRANCAIVLAEDASDELRRMADHLSRYFQYWRAHRDNPTFRYDLLWPQADEALRIPIIGPEEAADAGNLILLTDWELPEVTGVSFPQHSPKGTQGYVAVQRSDERWAPAVHAAHPGTLDATLRALLARLDERYPY